MKITRNSWKQALVLASAALALFLSGPVWADELNTNPLASDPAVIALGYTPAQQDYFDNHMMYGYTDYASFDTNDATLMKNRYFIRMGTNAFMERKSDSMESDIHPQLLNIHTGDTVSFWADGKTHAIQSYGGHGIFPQVVPLGSGQMYSYTFLKSGKYLMSDGLGKINCQCECMTIIVSGDSLTADSFMPRSIVTVRETASIIQAPPVEVPRLTRPTAPEPVKEVKAAPAAPRPRDKDVK